MATLNGQQARCVPEAAAPAGSLYPGRLSHREARAGSHCRPVLRDQGPDGPTACPTPCLSQLQGGGPGMLTRPEGAFWLCKHTGPPVDSSSDHQHVWLRTGLRSVPVWLHFSCTQWGSGSAVTLPNTPSGLLLLGPPHPKTPGLILAALTEALDLLRPDILGSAAACHTRICLEQSGFCILTGFSQIC